MTNQRLREGEGWPPVEEWTEALALKCPVCQDTILPGESYLVAMCQRRDCPETMPEHPVVTVVPKSRLDQALDRVEELEEALRGVLDDEQDGYRISPENEKVARAALTEMFYQSPGDTGRY